MSKKTNLGYPLIIWAILCLLPIPFAALFSTQICSIIYLVLWFTITILWGRLLMFIYPNNNSIQNKRLTLSCILLVLYYSTKIVLSSFNVLGYGNLGVIQYIGLINSLIFLIGLLLFFSNANMGVAGILFTISGFAMSITSLLTFAVGIGIVEWERFSLLTPIFSLIYMIGFIVSVIMCLRWIKKS